MFGEDTLRGAGIDRHARTKQSIDRPERGVGSGIRQDLRGVAVTTAHGESVGGGAVVASQRHVGAVRDEVPQHIGPVPDGSGAMQRRLARLPMVRASAVAPHVRIRTVGKQPVHSAHRLRCDDVVGRVRGEEVQRRVAVRIRAAVQIRPELREQREAFLVVVLRGVVQALAVGGCGTAFQQEPRQRDLAAHAREEQRRDRTGAVVELHGGVGISTGVEQHTHRRQMPLRWHTERVLEITHDRVEQRLEVIAGRFGARQGRIAIEERRDRVRITDRGRRVDAVASDGRRRFERRARGGEIVITQRAQEAGGVSMDGVEPLVERFQRRPVGMPELPRDRMLDVAEPDRLGECVIVLRGELREEFAQP